MIVWVEIDTKVLKEMGLEEGAERGDGRGGGRV
jgi:hypothetical protein